MSLLILFNSSAGVAIQVPSGSLTLTGFAPTALVTANHVIAVPAGALTVTGVAPLTIVPVFVLPGIGSLVLTGLVPIMAQTANHIRAPPEGVLLLTGLAPTVGISDSKVALPGVGSLVLTTTDATFTNSGDMRLILTGYAPTVSVGGSDQTVIVPVGSLTLTGLAPIAARTTSAAPGLGSLALTGFAPTIGVTQSAAPGVGSLILTGLAPTLVQTAHQTVQPNIGVLVLTGLAPTAVIDAASPTIAVPAGALTLTGLAPSAINSGDVAVVTGGGHSQRSRRVRYVVEIDKKFFTVASPQEAIELFRTIKATANEAVASLSEPVKIPRIRIKTAKGGAVTSQAVQTALRETQKVVSAIYQLANKKAEQRRALDNQIAELLQLKFNDEDEEDAILALLL